MRITAIELENFKGISDRVRVELKPITLLFGANSAGKSTILHALLYLRDVLDRRNLDAITTPVSGAALDLGGFRRFVHGRDLSRPIRIRVDMEVTGEELPEMAGNSGGPEWTSSRVEAEKLEEFEISRVHILQSIHSASVEIEVRWDQDEKGPVAYAYGVWLNGTQLSRIERSENSLTFAKFEFAHPAFVRYQHVDAVDDPLMGQLPDMVFDINLLVEVLPAFRNKHFYQGIRNWLPKMQDPIPEFLVRETLRLPDLDMAEYDDEISAEMAESLAWDGTAFLAKLIIGPGSLVRNWLHDLRYIGPLRARPPRKGVPDSELGDWAEGLAAWKVLEKIPHERFQEIGTWLSRKDRLNSGYGLTRKRLMELNAADIDAVLAGRPTKAQLRDLIKDAPERTQINLLETSSGLELAPSEVGVGLSQILPVVVAALNSPNGLVSIEQPELHIHPAIQVGLGDLFIEGSLNRGTQFLIETHSEHLILRLLRRIRETTDGELSLGLPEVKPEHIGVLYVDNGGAGMRITSLPIDETGEFTTRWPKGFFMERGEELF